MKKSRKTTILVLLAVILSCAVLAAVSLFVYRFLTPLNEPMALKINNTPIPLAVTVAENKAQGVCGNTGAMLVLFTGEDFKQGKWPLGADTVRVVKVDFSNKKIVVVGFPRDLWVKTPGLADQDFPETRLGLSYFYKKQATNGSDKHKVTVATAQVAQALLDNFGLQPEKYLTLQLQTVPQMIDTIGGLDIDVPEAFTTEYGVSFDAGPQHMDGAMAAEYLRAFAQSGKGSDLLRLSRQNIFIKALREKALSASIIPKIPDLYKQFDQAVVTDLSPKQIADLACMAREVPQKDIEFHEIVGGLVTEQADFLLMPDVEKIKEALKAWLDL